MAELPSCVRPRRRFVLRFLGACLVFLVLGHIVAHVRYAIDFNPETPLLVLLPFAVLALPCRSTSGTLMQLVGLVFPLCNTLCACIFCWAPADAMAQAGENGFNYMMMMAAGVALFFYLYPPIFGLGLLVHRLCRRFRSQS